MNRQSKITIRPSQDSRESKGESIYIYIYIYVYVWNKWNKSQLDATELFIANLLYSTCFGQYYAHHQELKIIQMFVACGT
jgi:hypothetical protein